MQGARPDPIRNTPLWAIRRAHGWISSAPATLETQKLKFQISLVSRVAFNSRPVNL